MKFDCNNIKKIDMILRGLLILKSRLPSNTIPFGANKSIVYWKSDDISQ